MSDVHGTTTTPPAEIKPGTEPLGNSTEARTPDGTIKDQTQNLPSDQKKDETKLADIKADDKKADDKKPAGAPEKYEPFTVPEGRELSPELVTEANTTFKDLNLSQEQGQKLVDLWNKQTSNISERLDAMVAETRNGWRKEVATDKTIGNGTDNLSDASKKAVSDAISAMGDAKVQEAFKAGLDLTGAGDHPDVIRGFVALGKLVSEGNAVKGGGPSPAGQTNTASRPSAAQALFPNLPSANRG